MTFLNVCSRIVRQVSDGVNKVCWWASASFLILMCLLVAVQVVARYVFFDPPPWTEEAARYAMVWMGLLGATVAFHGKFDPRIVEVSTTGPLWLLRLKRAIRSAAALAFVVPVVWYGMPFILRHSHRATDALKLNEAVLVSIVPIFAVIIVLHAVADLLSDAWPDDMESK